MAFGVLQWLALAAFVGWAVLCATGSRWAAGAAALAALSDVQLVYESLADLRPDVPLALIGLAALCFLVNFLRRRSPVSFIACGLLTAVLPLVHTTGVMPAAMMLTCVAVSALIPRDGRLSKPYLLACAMLAAVTLAVFIFRKPIADVLIPTKVPLADQLLGRHDLPAMVLGMAHRGLGWKLAQERQRWSSYFLVGNLPQLLFLLTGLSALLRAAWRRRSEMAAWLLLPAGWLAGIVILTATDPHFVPTHLIPLVAMGYVMAGVGWALLLDRRRPVLRTQGVLALAVLAFMCLGLRTAQAAVDVDQGIHQGVSRAAVSRLLTKVFPGTGVTWAVGPTSIWIYVPQSGRTVIVDRALPIRVSSRRRCGGGSASSSSTPISSSGAGEGLLARGSPPAGCNPSVGWASRGTSTGWRPFGSSITDAYLAQRADLPLPGADSRGHARHRGFARAAAASAHDRGALL